MEKTIQEYIMGMKEFDAKKIVEGSGYIFRVTHRDLINIVPFDPNDHNGDRINVEIENGIVTHFLIH
jgi:hypothetical protein